MWEITLSSQVEATLWSVPVGAALCLIYDFIRITRREFKTGIVFALISDILFFAFAAFITFCIFLIFCSGQIRFYVFWGLLSGFLIFRFTFSRFVIAIFTSIISLISWFVRPIIASLERMVKLFVKKLRKIVEFTVNILKKLLQPMCEMMYNLRSRKNNSPKETLADK